MTKDQGQPVLFSDMDGVLTDFEAHAARFLGRGWHELDGVLTDEQNWRALMAAAPEDYWASMPWLPDGRETWDLISQLHPYILSAPASRWPSCMLQKLEWCAREIGLPAHRIIIAPAVKKQEYAVIDGIVNILIDDNAKNIDQWRSRGGFGIYHTSATNTWDRLQKYLGR